MSSRLSSVEPLEELAKARGGARCRALFVVPTQWIVSETKEVRKEVAADWRAFLQRTCCLRILKEGRLERRRCAACSARSDEPLFIDSEGR